MPFTLAHPAAVLPLRRAPWLSLLPLVIGSMSPDFPYYLPYDIRIRLHITHTLLGSIAICLPVSLLFVFAIVKARVPLTSLLWEPHRTMFRDAIEAFRWPSAVPSILLGAWSHLLWDAFTHRTRWFVVHFALLRSQVEVMPGHSVALFHLLQYASSIFGLAVVINAYVRSLPPERHRGSRAPLLMIAGAALAFGAFGATRPVTTSTHDIAFAFLTMTVSAFVVLYIAAAAVVRIRRGEELAAER